MYSIMNDASTGDIDELPAKSSLPWVWFGFVFAFAFLTSEFLFVFLDLKRETFSLLLVLLVVAGWIYWLFCVFRFHTILREISRNHYPITAPEAVGKHFIPFYNFVWLFKWPAEFSDYINRRGRVKMASGNLLGLLLLISILLRFFDGAIALAGTFAVGTYISAKLGRHVQMIATPEMLPPPPDASMFRADPRQHSARPSSSG